MRSAVRVLALLTLVASFAATPSAPCKEAEDHPTSWDLLCRGIRVDGQGDWSSWWAVNRTSVLKLSFRASTTVAGGPRPADAAARGRARDALLAELKSKEQIVASEAAFALGRLGDPRDIATLAMIVGDGKEEKSGRLHRMAAVGLGLCPVGSADQATPAREALFAALEAAKGSRQPSPFFWTDCAYALALRADPASLDRVTAMCKDARAGPKSRHALQGEVLGAMNYALVVLGGDAAFPDLKAHVESRSGLNDGVTEAWTALHALTRIPGATARSVVLTATRDERVVVRRMALGALGALAKPEDDESASRLAFVMRNDDDPLCREAAAISLGRMAHPTSAAALTKTLHFRPSSGSSRDRKYLSDRSSAVLGLGLCARARPDPKTSEELVRHLEAADQQDERAAAALACGIAGLSTERARIADLMSGGRGDLLAPMAASALALIGAGPDERKALHEAVAQYQFADFRGEAALALGVLRDHTVVEQLRAIVGAKKSQDIDRASAAACLGYVGDDDDIDFLIGAITASGANEQVRACLVHALGRLLDRNENAALGRLSAESLWTYLSRGNPDAILDVQHMGD